MIMKSVPGKLKMRGNVAIVCTSAALASNRGQIGRTEPWIALVRGKILRPLPARGPVHKLCPDPVTLASDSNLASHGFWMPDGSATDPCHLQEIKPIYFVIKPPFLVHAQEK